MVKRSRPFNSLMPALSALVLVSLFSGCDKPPTPSLDNAKARLADAARAGAIRYAEPTYRKAEALVQSGWLEIARQNGRLGPLRDYKAADSILALAVLASQEAIAKAKDSVDRVSFKTRTGMDDLEKQIGNWTESVNGSLARYKLERFANAAELQLQVARSLHLRGEYDEALTAITKGNETLRQLSVLFADFADADARRLGIWQSWVNETLDRSRATDGYAVIVDKSAHKTYLVKSGRLIKSYNCELGYNSAHQKLLAGDGATPEGRYQVVQIKIRSSKYYKALLLDYPNEVDRKRFADNKRQGIISTRARIGGLI
ncbi:MAG: L,D-transpeptidase family protein, partial [candidate division Zixibacteria bacterium]|nr:L,D-transpeptidase family protein [candidate division Zixibacteria bacterium]